MSNMNPDGITQKVNKGKTNTINNPQDPSCSLVVEAVDEARQHDDLPSQGTIESQSGNQLPTNKPSGRDVHCKWLKHQTQMFSEKFSEDLWEEFVETSTVLVGKFMENQPSGQ